VTALLRTLEAPLLSSAPELLPFLKWPGGKSQELQAIAAAAPPLTGRYIDPFVGGGSILLAVPDDVEAWANDAAEDLVGIYRAAADGHSRFRDCAAGIAQGWDSLAGYQDVFNDLAEDFLAGGGGLPIVLGAGRRRRFEDLFDLAGPRIEDVFLAA
jgi:hypothetical protein